MTATKPSPRPPRQHCWLASLRGLSSLQGVWQRSVFLLRAKEALVLPPSSSPL